MRYGWLGKGRVIEVIQTEAFRRWVRRLRDLEALDRIDLRLLAAADGHLGDAAPLGGGLWEMRIHYGPGYRLYFIRQGAAVVVLLCGGDKDSHRRDIARARQMAAEWREDNA